MRMLEAIISARQNRPEQREGTQRAVMPEFPACAEKRNNGTGLFHHEDFVLLADETRAWIVQIEDISLLEACRNVTLVHLPEDKHSALSPGLRASAKQLTVLSRQQGLCCQPQPRKATTIA
jgi:hypothetical protein